MKKWVIAAVVAVIMITAVYVGSPYYAVNSIRNAAISADKDALEAKVDFPAVRESLKSQFSAAMMDKMQNDPEMKNNPFVGLAAMIAPAMIDRLVDAYITPDGMAAILRGQNPTEGAVARANPDLVFDSQYVGIDRFRVTSRNIRQGAQGPGFLFERRGFADWKLIKVELPAEIFSEPSS